MKKSKALKLISLMILIILVITLFVMPVGAKQIFSDLSPKHWCYNKIIDFEEKGYVCGYEDGTFRADRTITRAEYVKIVNNFFGYELETEKECGFSDVNKSDWFAPYVNEAVERGYITGYEDGTFRPEAPIRRQEATVILSRILDIDEEVYPDDHQDGLAQYSDGNEVQDWARVAIHSYSVYNFINGYEDGSLRILRDVTRAETVELLHILEQKVIIDKPSSGGGGSSIKRVKQPVISAYEMSGEELAEVSGWVNYETRIESGEVSGSLVKITTATEDATIYYSINGGDEQIYSGEFVVTDGKYVIKAHAEKIKMADSTTAIKTIDVDTVEPIVTGIKNEATVKILVEDHDKYDIGKENLSGLNVDTTEYAWFIKVGKKYVRETRWTSFANGDEIEFPTYPGTYYLGVKGEDIAENEIGVTNEFGQIDDTVEMPNIPSGESGDNPTDEPYVIVTENEIPEDEIPDEIPSGESGELPVNPTDKPVVVVINAKVTLEYYLETLEINEYELVESGETSGEVGTEIEIDTKNKEFPGFTLNKKLSVLEGTVKRDGSLVLKAYYKRDKDTPYTIKYYKETLSGDYELDRGSTETKKGRTGASVELDVTKNSFINKFTGFEFSGNHPANILSGDIAGDGSLVLKAYYVRKSYSLTLTSGDNIISVNGAGTYKYGQSVTISAELISGDGVEYEFESWKNEGKEFSDENEYTFDMPAEDLDLVADANEIDVSLLLTITDFEGKSTTKTFPEPGDWVEYKLTITNNGDTGFDVDIYLSSRSGDVSTSVIEDKEINKKTTTIEFKSTIHDEHPVSGEFLTEVVVKSSKTDKEIADTELTVNTEKTSAINFKKPTDKNIVMLIDLSGSMGFCTDENHQSLDTKGYLGDPIYAKEVSEDLNDTTVNWGTVKPDELVDLLFDGNDVRMDFEVASKSPWGYHLYDEGTKKCDAPVRIDVLIDALTKKNTGFIDIISSAASANKEEVSITLAIFNGYFEKDETGTSLAEVIGTYELSGNNTKLKSDIKELKYKLHSGTYVNTGLKEVVSITKEPSDFGLISGDSVENYFVFFGDGVINEESEDELKSIDKNIKTLKKYFDYMYAIGFGSDFANNTDGAKDLLAKMLKETGSDEPILASNASSITDAFLSIAQDIATSSQTENGWLTIEGKEFDTAVSKNLVFDIAVLDGDKLLFTISGDNVETVEWDNSGEKITTNVDFIMKKSKLKAVKIDLSGTAFSDKKNLKVVLDYKKKSN